MFLSLLKLASQSLSSNRWRAFLTMLGIIIGVAGVIVILSVGSGAQSLILNEITKLGSNVIGILPGATDDSGAPASMMGITVTTLKQDDLDKIKNDTQYPEISCIAGYVRGIGTLQSDLGKTETTILGTSHCVPKLEEFDMLYGRFFDQTEANSSSSVIVLGYKTAKDIFGDQNPVGQKIKLERQNFRIIGVAEERGSIFFTDQDSQVYIPLTTAQNKVLGIDYLNFSRISLAEDIDIDQTIELTKQILREAHNIDDPELDDFTVRGQSQALDILGSITDAIKFFLAAMAAIALLVGGIGIMNIMLVSVTERTKEIGLRKAIGATKFNIIWQFILEALVITVLGGILGIIVGSAIAGLVAIIANYMDYYWEFVISLQAIVISIFISGFIGIFFGIYPAVKAANLNPVDALRYE